MASVLGWDQARVEHEVEHYKAQIAAERESQLQPDDLSADAARMGVPDFAWSAVENEGDGEGATEDASDAGHGFESSTSSSSE
jgi:hypothetical protein